MTAAPATSAPTGTTDLLASLCKALGELMRVEILRVLSSNSYGVLELADIFEVTQPRISHHLKVLLAAELVSTRREGNSIFYRRPQLSPLDPLNEFKRTVFASIDECRLKDALVQRVERVHRARAEISSRFFLDRAPKFREQQDLIASHPVYAQAVVELLDNCELPHTGRALELGPGDGEFLPQLAARFTKITALDNSASMLDKARQHCAAQSNIEFILGDTTKLAPGDRYACAVVNMVLHHTPSPPRIFSDLYAALDERGVLLITELCPHDQAWAKEACGDVWLGFEPNDITQWAENAGFQTGQSLFFALRNGFQIQLQQFIKP